MLMGTLIFARRCACFFCLAFRRDKPYITLSLSLFVFCVRVVSAGFFIYLAVHTQLEFSVALAKGGTRL